MSPVILLYDNPPCAPYHSKSGPVICAAATARCMLMLCYFTTQFLCTKNVRLFNVVLHYIGSGHTPPRGSMSRSPDGCNVQASYLSKLEALKHSNNEIAEIFSTSKLLTLDLSQRRAGHYLGKEATSSRRI